MQLSRTTPAAMAEGRPSRLVPLSSRADFWAVLFLVAAVTAALWNVVLDPWRAVQEDMAFQWQGLHAAANEQIQQGRFPHWNPYALGGERLFANVSLGLLYPGSVLFRFLPFPAAAVWTWLLHYTLTAVAVYAFATTVLKALPVAAVVAAVGFALGGFSLGHCNHLNFVLALPYLPLLLLAVSHLTPRARPSRTIWWWLLGVFSLSSMILSGGAPILTISLPALVWLLGVFVWRAVVCGAYRQAVRLLASVVVMGAAALGLVAWQLLPTMDLYAVSARRDWHEVSFAAGAIPWRTLLCQLLAPGVLADPTTTRWAGAGHETYFFVGGVVLTFATAGLLSFRHNAWVPALAVLLALSLALATAWAPLLRAAEILMPAVKMRQPSRYLGLVHLAVALLAVVGVDSWLRSSPRFKLSRVGVIGIAVSIIACASYAVVVHHLAVAAPAAEHFHASHPLTLQASPEDPFSKAATGGAANASSRSWFALAAWSLAGVTVFLATLLRRSGLQNAATGFVCVWCVLEFIPWAGQTWAGQGRSPAVTEQDTPITDFLQRNLDGRRYFNAAGYPPLLANRGAIYGLENVEGYVASKLTVSREHQAFLLRLRGQPNALKLFATKYVLLGADQSSGSSEPVFRENGVVVHQAAPSAERCFFLTHVRSVADAREAINIMANAAFDPGKTALVCGAPEPLDQVYPLLGAEESCVITRWDPGEIEIAANCEARRWLLVATSYDPGWTALLDGRPVALYRTDACLVSLEVPQGRHSVRLSYQTPGFKTGAAMSAMSAILILAPLGVRITIILVRRRRSRGTPTAGLQPPRRGAATGQ